MRFLPLAVFVAGVALGGCASPGSHQPHLPADGNARDCLAWYAALDDLIDRAGVRDAGEARLPGRPHLRADRFSASFGDAARSNPTLAAALHDRLRVNGINAHGHEIRNLPPAVRRQHGLDLDETLARLQGCSVALARVDLLPPDVPDAWLKTLSVPDHYAGWKRFVGLYPLTSRTFFRGIEQWQRETESAFRAASQAFAGTRYRAASDAAAAPGEPHFQDLPRDPLGIPLLSPAAWQSLLARHAPVVEIDQRGTFDQPGALVHDATAVTVDTSQPVTYQRIAFTRLAGRTLTQLVYSFWFAERPPRGWLDLLAGRLDGVMIRITLDERGLPLMVDSIHACGCYHLFMPGERLAARAPPQPGIEWAFVPQRLPALRPGQRLVVRIASGTHYVVGLDTDAASGVSDRTYRLADEQSLQALLLPGGGSRSVYDHAGLIAGSERGERFWFWPMGIASPGAMRQWGHHATAFVGRRHFDDADLIDRRFILLPPK